LSELEQVIEPDHRRQMVVFGSAAVILSGVNLGRPATDLDIFVSSSLFDRLGRTFGVKRRPAPEGDEIAFIAPVDGAAIEIVKFFFGVEFRQVLSRSHRLQGAGGFRLGALGDLRRWKLAHDRPKDRRDIERIDRYIGGAYSRPDK
jgi:hypothetical protein